MSINPLKIDLNLLKDAIRHRSQLPMNSLGNCNELSRLIFDSTNLQINEVVIKRLFGFEQHKFPPSQYTLDALIVYSGFNEK